MAVAELSVQELKRRLDAGENLVVLDVREPWEVALAKLPDIVHIPLGQLPARLQELEPDSNIVAMCKSGGRSHRAAEFLSSKGFGRVANLSGGIDAWRQEIDPSLSSY